MRFPRGYLVLFALFTTPSAMADGVVFATKDDIRSFDSLLRKNQERRSRSIEASLAPSSSSPSGKDSARNGKAKKSEPKLRETRRSFSERQERRSEERPERKNRKSDRSPKKSERKR